MKSESFLRQRALGLLSDIALHKLVMVSRLLTGDMGAKSDINFIGGATDASHATPGGIVYGNTVGEHMAKRDWTPEQVDYAFKHGTKIPAFDSSTRTQLVRYIHPETTRSIVIDPETSELVHVGRAGFIFRPKSRVAPIALRPGGGSQNPIPDPPPGGGNPGSPMPG